MTSIVRVIAFAVVAFVAQPARAACVVPNRALLIRQDFAGCCSVVIGAPDGAGPGLRWVAVNWEGPLGGKLYIVNCGAQKIAEVDSLGYVERLERTRRIGRMATIAVTYVPATGTNIQTRSVALVQYRSGSIHTLWSHPTLDAAYTPLTPTNEEHRTSWQYRNGYSRIEATTTVQERPRRSRSAPKPVLEKYCFRTSVWRYIPCD